MVPSLPGICETLSPCIFLCLLWFDFHKFYCCFISQSCLTLCDPMDCSMPGFPALHYLLKFAQTHQKLYNSEEKKGRTSYDLNHSKILYDSPPKIIEIKPKMTKWDLI